MAIFNNKLLVYQTGANKSWNFMTWEGGKNTVRGFRGSGSYLSHEEYSCLATKAD